MVRLLHSVDRGNAHDWQRVRHTDFKRVEEPVKQETPGEGAVLEKGDKSKAVSILRSFSLIHLVLSDRGSTYS